MNQIATLQNNDIGNSLIEFQQTQELCQSLMKTKHYAALGEVGIYTIIQKSRSIGLNPLDALNGGMYFVNGKVELSANMMNCMIRAKGHSITKDPKSNHEICILHGKRADNGDTWTESFSIAEAKQAGIFKNVWEKYPKAMLFARALTLLARQLFPDVCKGCYVEGEISSAIEAERSPIQNYEVSSPPSDIVIEQKINTDQYNELKSALDRCDPKYVEKVLSRLKEMYPPITRLEDLTINLFDQTLVAAKKAGDNYQKKVFEQVQNGEIEVPNE